jgi:Tfp pilus assembly pilus retraction ATPase PilT
MDADRKKTPMTSYSIPDLLQLLKKKRGERVRVEVGYSAVLIIKGQPHEIEGPLATEESMEEMLRTVANTRELRAFRREGKLDVVFRLNNTNFLVRAIRAFGEFRLEMQPVPA